MTSSSTVRTGSGTWCTCGRCWESWGGAGLTANPKKCAIWAGVEVRYLGFHLGHADRCVPKLIRRQLLRPARDLRPKRRWGSSWGWRGITGGLFLTIRSSPARWLTSLKRRSQIRSRGTERCQQVFTQVKAALCGGPLLHSPDFSSPLLAADGRVGPGAGSCPDPGDRGWGAPGAVHQSEAL